MKRRLMHPAAGLSIVEVLFALAIGVTVTGIAIPLTADAVREVRAAAAGRYLASRIVSVRMDAVRRSKAVALRFIPSGSDYQYAVFEDGNGNGVRTTDIAAGIDTQVTPYERLGDKFPGIRFALPAGIPDADGAASASEDGVRIGTPRILTMTPDGSCTGGTLYLTGRGGTYAVRTLGATGRTRVLYFDEGEGAWINQ